MTEQEFRLCYRVPGDDPSRVRVMHRAGTLESCEKRRQHIIATARGETERNWKMWIESRTVTYTEWAKADG